MTSPESQEALFDLQGNFPSTPRLYENVAITELADPFFADQHVGEIYIASLLQMPGTTTAPGQRDLNQTVIESLYSWSIGTTSATDRWNDTLADLTELMER